MNALAYRQPPAPLLAAVPTCQQRVDACVRRLVARPDLPVLPCNMHGLLAAAESETTSFAGLARFVSLDLGLTAKVLRVVNSGQYASRMAASPVPSVSRAVSMLGIDAVAEFAATALSAAQTATGLSGVKPLMLTSLITAHHARQVALRARFPWLEDAFLCGMLRNLGEVLVAYHLPEEYATILREMCQGSDERTACFRVLEFSYEDLGKGMARQWNLPERPGQCMERWETFQCRSASGIDRLRMVTNFSHGLTEAVYRRDPAESHSRLSLLIDRFGDALGLAECDLKAIVKLAAGDAKDVFEASGIPVSDLRLGRQVELARLEPEPSARAAGASAGNPGESLEPREGQARNRLFRRFARL